MNVATIGSGVIVERMIEAMRLDGRYNLYCVYSRTEKRAKEFAEKHGIQKYYTDMEEMLNDENVDIVYVASPNSLHYSQSKMALEHKKHVINEKPFTPTLKECNELFEIAEKKGVYIFEAITNVHLPNYKIIKENMSNCGNIKMVQCNFSQYSSKYQKYKDHVQTNAFDTAFNGGALMDINVYNLHFVTGMFGKPNEVHYFKNVGYNGIDTSGIIIMQYPDFIATCTGAKDCSSPYAVYVQGDQGTIIVSGASSGVCKDVYFDAPKKDQIGKKATDTKEKISIEQPNHMLYECQDFMDIILNKDEEAAYYRCRSFNYRHIYNKETCFFHPKDKNGKWISPFDYRFSGGQGASEYMEKIMVGCIVGMCRIILPTLLN